MNGETPESDAYKNASQPPRTFGISATMTGVHNMLGVDTSTTMGALANLFLEQIKFYEKIYIYIYNTISE